MYKRILICLILIFTLVFSTSCVAKSFEKEINVVFLTEDGILDHDTVTQFKNIKTPTLPESYIPVNYKFFGWTALNPDTIRGDDPNISEKYIKDGKMVHFGDVEKYVNNTTVVLRPLMIDKAEIPVVYHHVVIAWYDKPATSGIDSDLMKTFEESLFAHLRSQGVSEEELKTIVIRGYTGNVGTSCGQIMEDEDVDIMLGWSSRDNVTSTGGMKEEMLKETIDLKVGEKNRKIHRLTDKETAVAVFEWLKSSDVANIFK